MRNMTDLYSSVIAVAAAFALLAAPAADGATNLILNGSFEQPDIDDPPADLDGGVGVPGEWQVIGPDDWISVARRGDPADPEIQNGLWAPQDGDQYLEMDSHGYDKNARILQSVNLEAGTRYEFSFYWAPRPDGGENSLLYSLGGDLASAFLGGSGNNAPRGGDPGWTKVSHIVQPDSSGSYNVVFTGLGDVDNRGIFLDNVSLVVVPAPPAALLGLAGFAIVAAIRRRTRARS